MYINELSRKLSVDSGNLTRKLYELEKEGLLVSEQQGRETFFKLNTEYSLLEHYRKIVLATVGIEQLLKQALADVSGVEIAFIYGSYASDSLNSSSDIDVMVVGSHKALEVQKKISKLQRETDREINVISIDKEEFDRGGSTFLSEVKKGKRVTLI